jgi:hypothetical protein
VTAKLIFFLWLMHNPTIGENKDVLLDAFETQQACEQERLSGEFAPYFRCLPASGLEASSAALLFAKMQNCEADDDICSDLKMQQSRIQRMRYPSGPLEKLHNKIVGW